MLTPYDIISRLLFGNHALVNGLSETAPQIHLWHKYVKLKLIQFLRLTFSPTSKI